MINNCRGSSLIAVMVAGAVAATIITGIFKTLQSVFRSQRQIQMKIDSMDMSKELELVFRDQAGCLATFQNLTIQTSSTADQNYGGNPSLNTVNGTLYSNYTFGKLKLSRFSFQKVISNGNVHEGWLSIHVTDLTGDPIVPAMQASRVRISFDTTGPAGVRTITNCVSGDSSGLGAPAGSRPMDLLDGKTATVACTVLRYGVSHGTVTGYARVVNGQPQVRLTGTGGPSNFNTGWKNGISWDYSVAVPGNTNLGTWPTIVSSIEFNALRMKISGSRSKYSSPTTQIAYCTASVLW